MCACGFSAWLRCIEKRVIFTGSMATNCQPVLTEILYNHHSRLTLFRLEYQPHCVRCCRTDSDPLWARAVISSLMLSAVLHAAYPVTARTSRPVSSFLSPKAAYWLIYCRFRDFRCPLEPIIFTSHAVFEKRVYMDFCSDWYVFQLAQLHKKPINGFPWL